MTDLATLEIIDQTLQQVTPTNKEINLNPVPVIDDIKTTIYEVEQVTDEINKVTVNDSINKDDVNNINNNLASILPETISTEGMSFYRTKLNFNEVKNRLIYVKELKLKKIAEKLNILIDYFNDINDNILNKKIYALKEVTNTSFIYLSNKDKDILKEMLNSSDYVKIYLNNSKEAVSLLDSLIFDLIYIDNSFNIESNLSLINAAYELYKSKENIELLLAFIVGQEFKSLEETISNISFITNTTHDLTLRKLITSVLAIKDNSIKQFEIAKNNIYNEVTSIKEVLENIKSSIEYAEDSYIFENLNKANKLVQKLNMLIELDNNLSTTSSLIKLLLLAAIEYYTAYKQC